MKDTASNKRTKSCDKRLTHTNINAIWYILQYNFIVKRINFNAKCFYTSYNNKHYGGSNKRIKKYIYIKHKIQRNNNIHNTITISSWACYWYENKSSIYITLLACKQGVFMFRLLAFYFHIINVYDVSQLHPNTLLKSDVTRRDHVSVVMDPMNAGSRNSQFHSQFHSRWYSHCITLKYTTLVHMRSGYAWTMKSWQRSEWHLGFNSIFPTCSWIIHTNVSRPHQRIYEVILQLKPAALVSSANFSHFLWTPNGQNTDKHRIEDNDEQVLLKKKYCWVPCGTMWAHMSLCREFIALPGACVWSLDTYFNLLPINTLYVYFMCRNFIPSKILSSNIYPANFIYNANRIFTSWEFYCSHPSARNKQSVHIVSFPVRCKHSHPSAGHTTICKPDISDRPW